MAASTNCGVAASVGTLNRGWTDAYLPLFLGANSIWLNACRKKEARGLGDGVAGKAARAALATVGATYI